jgi:hypothetical protein
LPSDATNPGDPSTRETPTKAGNIGAATEAPTVAGADTTTEVSTENTSNNPSADAQTAPPDAADAPTNTNGSSKDGRMSTGMGVLIVVGVLLVPAIIVVSIMLWRKKPSTLVAPPAPVEDMRAAPPNNHHQNMNHNRNLNQQFHDNPGSSMTTLGTIRTHPHMLLVLAATWCSMPLRVSVVLARTVVLVHPCTVQ